MRKAFLSSVLVALLASVSVGAYAAAPVSGASGNMAPAMVDTQPVVDRININTADGDTLQKSLSGIGRSKAEAIIAYRQANGDFTSVDELVEVKGIGKALLEKNRDRLTVE